MIVTHLTCFPLPPVRPCPDEVPGLHRALPLDLDRPTLRADELVLQQIVRRTGDLDLPRRPVRLHPARRVHRVAPQVVQEPLRADHPGDDRPELIPIRQFEASRPPPTGESAITSRMSSASSAARRAWSGVGSGTPEAAM